MTITKNQKMLLGVGAVAVVGYLVYQQMNKKSFAGEKMNASGRVFAKTRASSTCGPGDVCSGPAGNLCGESCMNGYCYFIVYGADDKPKDYILRKCD